MIDIGIWVYLFMLSIGFGVLIVDYHLAAEYDITLTNFEGVPITSEIVQAIDIDKTQEQISSISQGTNGTIDRVGQFATSAAFVAWEFITLITGTYVLIILVQLGMPYYAAAAIFTIYAILIVRTIIGLIRGV